LYWQRSSLEYLFVKETYLATVVTTLIARDITTKLYAMNKKVGNHTVSRSLYDLVEISFDISIRTFRQE
jgi:hypothetical protein